MITQRPVTGSLRNSGTVECVLINLDNRAAGVEMDRHHVKPAWIVRQPATSHVIERELHHPPPLDPRDRFGGVAEVVGLARLHFDEDQRLAIPRDDVQFSTPPAGPTSTRCFT